MADLVNVLVGVAGSWDIFLGQLGVKTGEIDCIRNDNAHQSNFSKRCLLQGLHDWVLSDLSPTYERVARALRGDMLRQDLLAVEVEQFAKRLPTGYITLYNSVPIQDHDTQYIMQELQSCSRVMYQAAIYSLITIKDYDFWLTLLDIPLQCCTGSVRTTGTLFSCSLRTL